MEHYFYSWLSLSDVDAKVLYVESNISDVISTYRCMFFNPVSSLMHCLEALPVEGHVQMRHLAAVIHLYFARKIREGHVFVNGTCVTNHPWGFSWSWSRVENSQDSEWVATFTPDGRDLWLSLAAPSACAACAFQAKRPIFHLLPVNYYYIRNTFSFPKYISWCSGLNRDPDRWRPSLSSHLGKPNSMCSCGGSSPTLTEKKIYAAIWVVTEDL